MDIDKSRHQTLTHTVLRNNINLGLHLCILLVAGLLLVLDNLHLHLLDLLVEYFQVLGVVPHSQVENGPDGDEDSSGEVKSVSVNGLVIVSEYFVGIVCETNLIDSGS